MTGSTEKRWPLDLKFRNEIERQIYDLQARLYCDPDEAREIRDRIEQLRAQLGEG